MPDTRARPFRRLLAGAIYVYPLVLVLVLRKPSPSSVTCDRSSCLASAPWFSNFGPF